IRGLRQLGGTSRRRCCGDTSGVPERRHPNQSRAPGCAAPCRASAGPTGSVPDPGIRLYKRGEDESESEGGRADGDAHEGVRAGGAGTTLLEEKEDLEGEGAEGGERADAAGHEERLELGRDAGPDQRERQTQQEATAHVHDQGTPGEAETESPMGPL